MRKLKVYVSGPISKGNQFQNCAKAIRVGTQIMRMGAAPFVPHLSALWDLVDGDIANITYDDWLELDLAWVTSCDVVLRLPGESQGADREVDFAESEGIPIIYSIGELSEYIQLVNSQEEPQDGDDVEEALEIVG